MTRMGSTREGGFEGCVFYVVGASSASQSIARFLLRAGHRVLLSDADVNRALESATAELGGELAFSRGRHELAFVGRADVVVLSPEISADDEIVRYARSRGKRILSSIDFIASGRRAMPVQRHARPSPAPRPQAHTSETPDPNRSTQATTISTFR